MQVADFNGVQEYWNSIEQQILDVVAPIVVFTGNQASNTLNIM